MTEKIKKLHNVINCEKIKVVNDNIPIHLIKGLYCDSTIVIDESVETIHEYNCVLAEELGHHFTTSGNILIMNTYDNARQERRAREWAYRLLISFEDLIIAYQRRIEHHNLADFLEVTECFLIEALEYYNNKYYKVMYKNYTIQFSPLKVSWFFEGTRDARGDPAPRIKFL